MPSFTEPVDGRHLDTRSLDAVPIFPLAGTVLFPGALLPLHVFEPRYRAMTRDCLAGSRMMVVAHVATDATRDENGHPSLAPIAGIGRVVDHVALPDGRFEVLLQGLARVHLAELEFVAPYRRARATVVPSTGLAIASSDLSPLCSAISSFAAVVRARDPEFDFRVPKGAPPELVVDLAAHELVLDAHERQALLETLDVRARMRRCADAIALQHAAARPREAAGEALN